LKHQSDKDSWFDFLISYERAKPYPVADIGFLYDVGAIYRERFNITDDDIANRELNAFGGTFAKPHKPNAKAKFCKRATKPTHQDTATWTDNNTTEKKHEPVTAVLQKSGFSG
jgi:hypothetical protein